MKKVLLKKEDIHKGNLILVNSEHKIRENSISKDLKAFNNLYPEMLFDSTANLELQKILAEIKSENKIVPVSAFRTLEDQENIWNDSLKENGEKFTRQYVANPNCSEHQTGLAIDLALNQENIDFIRPAFPYEGICQEFRKTMTKYGFIERYKPEKEEITKTAGEEWHFRYVSYPHSKIIEEMNFCLEEYIDYLNNFKFGQNSLEVENYEIFCVEMDEDVKEINFEDDEIFTISGNNVNGFIITITKSKKAR